MSLTPAKGDVWESNMSGRKYTLIDFDATNNIWNVERDDGLKTKLTSVFIDTGATLIQAAATANTPAPASNTAQPVVPSPKYWVGQKVTSNTTGAHYTIHAYDPAKQEYSLIKSNGMIVSSYSVQALDTYVTIDPGQTPPIASTSAVAAPAATPTYKIGDKFSAKNSKLRYTIKQNATHNGWLMECSDGALWWFSEKEIVDLLIPDTTATKVEPKKPCCGIGALKAEEGLPCPLHKPAKPKYDFSDLVSEWDLLPDAKPEKEKKQ